MNQQVVKELIQGDCNADKIRQELDLLLNDENYRERMLTNFELLRDKLGGQGASKKVAHSLLKTISE
jgi:lipid-A-disaccharide synthase